MKLTWDALDKTFESAVKTGDSFSSGAILAIYDIILNTRKYFSNEAGVRVGLVLGVPT